MSRIDLLEDDIARGVYNSNRKLPGGIYDMFKLDNREYNYDYLNSKLELDDGGDLTPESQRISQQFWE